MNSAFDLTEPNWLPLQPPRLWKARTNVEAGGLRMVSSAAKLKPKLFELEPELAVDRVGPVASDVDAHFSRAVFKHATHSRGKAGLMRPTKWPRITWRAARATVPKIKPTVFEALLAQSSATAEHLGMKAAPNGGLAIGLTRDVRRAERAI
jgi:hypothetical protein